MRSMDDIGAGRDIAPNSTVRMTSDRNFWGVTAYDWDTNISDWGHSWLAKKFLTNIYTVGFGPGNQNQPPDTSQWGNPVFVAATADRTRVQFDLENDGIYDAVDLDGDGVADAAPYPDNTYEVDMLETLKVTRPGLAAGDNDMTGARIIANKPIVVSWGQDTDRAYYSDDSLDTGFTVYPVNQLFLDPALTIDKTADKTVVPLSAGTADDRIATYTLTVKSYDFGPLTEAKIFDLLPIDVAASDYIPGSTLIHYPDLTQDSPDPTSTTLASGRVLLEWPLTSDPPWESGDPDFAFGTDETLRVEYKVRIPVPGDGLPRRLLNQGRAEASLGSSVFTPTDLYALVQTDAEVTKSVDTANPGPGDVLTFTLVVTNNSTTTDEDNVFVSDAIPPDTTYCDSTTNPGVCSDPTGTTPFSSGTFDPGQNAVEWTALTLGTEESATLTFQVIVNPTTPAGTVIPNRAGYESDLTPYFLSNEVTPVVIGPNLDAVKSIVGNPSVAHPYEVITFDIAIENTGTSAASNVFMTDPFPTNAGYVSSSIEWSLNSGPFVALTDANDGDEGGGADGRAFADRIEFRLDSLGAGQNVDVRFKVEVAPGTAGQFTLNQATFASDETPSTDTNLVQVPIVGDSAVTGHVFLDLDGNGVQDPVSRTSPNIDVVVTDPTGTNNGSPLTRTVTTRPLSSCFQRLSAATSTRSMPPPTTAATAP